MLKEYKNHWLASHLYYSEPWDELLVKAVKPFANSILDEGLSSRFFFIRYWERGPHVRLRFLLDSPNEKDQIQLKINSFFKDHFKLCPSKDIAAEFLKQLPEDQKWFPNNSVQFIEYEPEIDRYGGIFVMDLAEQHFYSSSKCVLAAMTENESWSYEKAMGTAIQLHLTFAFAVGMTLEEVKSFYDIIYRAWFLRAYYSYEKGVSKEELEQRANQTKELFSLNFEKQKEMLVATHQSIWEAISDGVQFEQDWLNTWIEENKMMSDRLIAIQTEGGLSLPSHYKNIDVVKGVDSKVFHRMAIYESFIHMTNNRLGILNRDEAFLGYLIKKSVESL